MNTKSLLATLLVLGSSTAALAKPVVRDHREGAWQVTNDRDHRTASSYRDRQNFGRSGDRNDNRSWGDRDGDRDRDRGGVVAAPPVVIAPVAVDTSANVRIGAKASVYTGPIGTAPSWGGWVELVQPTMIARGFEQIGMGRSYGTFSELQLVANRGDTKITQVVVQFADGQYQSVPLYQELDGGNPTITIDLAGGRRAIQRILVEGSSGYGARYSIRAA